MAQSVPRIIKLKYFFEKYGFHVSSRLADSLGMRVTSVRLFLFTYLLLQQDFGFGIFNLAFWIKLKI
jgi:hypothetical protein